ncbi:MAG: DNA repair protein RadA [Pseudomonadota bacterium]
MSKSKTIYVCDACGATSPKWLGRCPDCGAWNSLVESLPMAASANTRHTAYAVASHAQDLTAVVSEETPRVSTGLQELDRVLGGGQVAGAAMLLGGDPGIGKSTLLLQAVSHLAQSGPALYVTGEESAGQVAMRARRLDLSSRGIRLLAENNLEQILAQAQTESPAVLVVDSIQTVFSDALQSAPGSVAQVRECAAQLVRYAKRAGVAVWLVGHVTKEGTLAGPRVLEHMVDTVLYFEGEPGNSFRIVRAIKNRFGAVNELGVFSMTDKGLAEVDNPSSLFLSQHAQPVPGSAVLVTQEGTRPLLVEVQALVSPSPLANPRRVAIGLDPNRLSMLLAVLHRHGSVPLFDQDVFINVVGGVRLNEPAADLAVVMALLSSFRNRPLDAERVLFGEVGLAGEVRAVSRAGDRLKEAAKLGFKRAMLPAASRLERSVGGIKVLQVDKLGDALDLAFD